jgi:hypothetical protein
MKKKRCKVVMLPTDKASASIAYSKQENAYVVASKLRLLEITQGFEVTSLWSWHHLYITSDDKIESGDWCLFFWDGNKEGELGQIGSEPQQYFPENGHTLNKNLRKIIATTDSKLKLPQPSQSFIEEYCRKGGIDEVDVEYEVTPSLKTGDNYNIGGEVREVTDVWLGTNNAWYVSTPNNHAWSCPIELKPKVNSDNTINIHPIEEKMYSETELIQFVLDNRFRIDSDTTIQEIISWIKK